MGRRKRHHVEDFDRCAVDHGARTYESEAQAEHALFEIKLARVLWPDYYKHHGEQSTRRCRVNPMHFHLSKHPAPAPV